MAATKLGALSGGRAPFAPYALAPGGSRVFQIGHEVGLELRLLRKGVFPEILRSARGAAEVAVLTISKDEVCWAWQITSIDLRQRFFGIQH
jgi:hypothetical protein